MLTILIAGAGKSSTYLIEETLKYASLKKNNWHVIVADGDKAAIEAKVKEHPHAEVAAIDIGSDRERGALVKRADIVISVMPPHLHILLAKDCLQYKKHLITSSYISPEMRELDQAAKDAGLMFMCEMGLDPGIDHMTASMIFDSAHKVASEILVFKSYCGGLVAPESDDNPWHYKFSWNPRNIINAGKDGAHYMENGRSMHTSYQNMFRNNKVVDCGDAGSFAYYPNRDSLSYIDLYKLPQVQTMLRATLRHPDFCKGWFALQQLGLTDTEQVFDASGMTYASWIKQVTGHNDNSKSVNQAVWQQLGNPDEKLKYMLEWLGIFEDMPLDAAGPVSSGDILLQLLSSKWAMQPYDKDMVVMKHEIAYKYRDFVTQFTSTMQVIGEGGDHSAMAKTVGLPMAILAEMIINRVVEPPHGVLIPNMYQVYRPVLFRLAKKGIIFEEQVAH
jgi:saccharopine dehydrogenase-like NADP-dependent oxidoreductase